MTPTVAPRRRLRLASAIAATVAAFGAGAGVAALTHRDAESPAAGTAGRPDVPPGLIPISGRPLEVKHPRRRPAAHHTETTTGAKVAQVGASVARTAASASANAGSGQTGGAQRQAGSAGGNTKTAPTPTNGGD